MPDVNIVIRSSDGDILGYAFSNPFEIGCIDRLSDRFEQTLSSIKTASDAHTELTDIDAGTVIPPHTEPVAKQVIITELCFELMDTTPFEFDESPTETVEQARAAVNRNVVYSEDDLPSDQEYYDFLAQKTYEIANELGEGTERMVQRRLESFLTQSQFEKAVEKTREEFDVMPSETE